MHTERSGHDNGDRGRNYQSKYDEPRNRVKVKGGRLSIAAVSGCAALHGRNEERQGHDAVGEEAADGDHPYNEAAGGGGALRSARCREVIRCSGGEHEEEGAWRPGIEAETERGRDCGNKKQRNEARDEILRGANTDRRRCNKAKSDEGKQRHPRQLIPSGQIHHRKRSGQGEKSELWLADEGE